MLRNITLSAELQLLRRAREKAMKEKRSLNYLFREWLSHYVTQGKTIHQYHDLMKKLNYANPGRKFLRDELNER